MFSRENLTRPDGQAMPVQQKLPTERCRSRNVRASSQRLPNPKISRSHANDSTAPKISIFLQMRSIENVFSLNMSDLKCTLFWNKIHNIFNTLQLPWTGVDLLFFRFVFCVVNLNILDKERFVFSFYCITTCNFSGFFLSFSLFFNSLVYRVIWIVDYKQSEHCCDIWAWLLMWDIFSLLSKSCYRSGLLIQNCVLH